MWTIRVHGTAASTRACALCCRTHTYSHCESVKLLIAPLRMRSLDTLITLTSTSALTSASNTPLLPTFTKYSPSLLPHHTYFHSMLLTYTPTFSLAFSFIFTFTTTLASTLTSTLTATIILTLTSTLVSALTSTVISTVEQSFRQIIA